MPDGRTIAIGDIHGCATALQTLFDALELTADDTLVALGDAIDRGPDSRGVIEQLLAIRERCRLAPLFGNHEQMMLDAANNRVPLQDWLFHGGAETLDSYGKNAGLSAVPEEHLEFIGCWGDYYETESHFFAHGNYQANLPLAEQPWEIMRWRSLKFSMPAAHQSGKIAILGHTASKQGKILDKGHLICIDTYCHGGKWLTALEPATGQVWQTNQEGELRSG
ncbi:MAG: serine/threonine protein phosphatase [Pirellulales bacterium]|nr:serine/threonine protein phosphatase [Pirellulales bacterium]